MSTPYTLHSGPAPAIGTGPAVPTSACAIGHIAATIVAEDSSGQMSGFFSIGTAPTSEGPWEMVRFQRLESVVAGEPWNAGNAIALKEYARVMWESPHPFSTLSVVINGVS